MNQSEQIAALTQLVVWMHIKNGEAQALRRKAFGSVDSIGKLAKLCGTTAEIVTAWETGKLRPTPTQAIAWLTALHEHDRGVES